MFHFVFSYIEVSLPHGYSAWLSHGFLVAELRGLFTLDERLIAEHGGNSSTPSIGSELSAFHVALRGAPGVV
jgi:hypothetical protein